MLEELRGLSRHFLTIKHSTYRRYFIQTTKFKHRMNLIVGPRGAGKTTTLVQMLLEHAAGNSLDPSILYIQADHFLIGKQSLYEIAEQFQQLGGKWLVFDEIHKYPEWSKELKSIYDTFPDLSLFASGSSALEIHKGSHDLTRRAAVYSIQGMSFREYLELSHSLQLPSYSLEEICQHHEKITEEILQQLGSRKILPEFHRYLKIGYYPYFHEIQDEAVYNLTLEQNVHATIESDLAAIYPELTGNSIQKMKKLLSFIANAVPFQPNWHTIQQALEIGDIRTLKTYFSHLEDAGLIRSVPKASDKRHALESIGKIYLDNPNLLFAICSKAPEQGTVRETFFLNMLSQSHAPKIPLNGDFLVDNLVFEVGGKNKTFRQIKGEQNAYVVSDNIEKGIGGKIPLWLFGFLY